MQVFPNMTEDISFPYGHNETCNCMECYSIRKTLHRSRVKRPPNCFLLFSKDRKKHLIRENPNKTLREVSTMVAEAWYNLSKEEKQPYIDEAERLKMEFQKKYPDYYYGPNTLMKTMRTAKHPKPNEIGFTKNMVPIVEKKIKFEEKKEYHASQNYDQNNYYNYSYYNDYSQVPSPIPPPPTSQITQMEHHLSYSEGQCYDGYQNHEYQSQYMPNYYTPYYVTRNSINDNYHYQQD
ncbi:High mobility group box domain-containing protein [Strongyloides ratti]|uniref:Sex-determining region Y protein n=1 Tax=Strongyloides ratti TaxID=34506 RepID=A0A090L344_STRRB|nr:High mobility group box domain-containing protein [Strongyloides ratti]CEF61909.1 High mobility group box domain-containing protein [Strongyloides ratti]